MLCFFYKYIYYSSTSILAYINKCVFNISVHIYKQRLNDNQYQYCNSFFVKDISINYWKYYHRLNENSNGKKFLLQEIVTIQQETWNLKMFLFLTLNYVLKLPIHWKFTFLISTLLHMGIGKRVHVWVNMKMKTNLKKF